MDTMDMLESEQASECGGVMHCFAEDWATAKRALDIGFYISFSGILTFKNAQDMRDVAKKVPLDLVLVETDSPYLAPVPMRGKTNEPAFTRYVADVLAEVKGISKEEIALATTTNFFNLFQAAQRTEAA
jgi:TatD DNase family protein